MIDKILSRIRSWEGKKLTYAGMLTLTKSVLNSLFVYWGSIFVLPKGVIKKVESTLIALFVVWCGTKTLKNH